MLQRLLIVGIVCLAPMMIYFLILVGVNSRRRASLVPGSWDFAGVLLACSGFLIAGGPLVLAGISAVWRTYILRGRPSEWSTLFGQSDARSLLIWIMYFLIVIFGATSLIWRRRSYTVIYNVDTEHLWSALEWVFGRLAIVWQRRESRYELQRPRRPAADWRCESTVAADAIDANEAAPARLTVHVLPSSRNATLHWQTSEPEIRDQVEAEIGRLLPNIRAEENPAVGWLVTIASGLFALIVFAIVMLLIIAVRWRQTLGV